MTAATLYGREPERSRIHELLAGAHASRSAALLITGEPGVGKSTLLEDAGEHASDMRVLRAGGVESEANLPFAALHHVVRPILGLIDAIPPPQAAALERALGLARGAGGERFLVSLAALSVLAEAAERKPVLCLVDDAHWLDDASAEALMFVARRLGAEGIVMLFAAREGEGRALDASGIPLLRLGGLDPAAAAALVDDHAGRALSAEVRDRLISDTGGNPLALLELSSALTEDQLSGAEPLLAPLPVTGRVQRAFLARVRRLPDATQSALLIAAADDAGDLATVLRASARLGIAGDALDSAEESGLIQVRGQHLAFRHPLIRSAVYQAAPLSKRQAAHRALANVLAGEAVADRRAWHLAAATVEPDPSVVDELERAADRARQRSGFSAASVAMERAAALAGDDRQRARHLAAAAQDAWLAGQADRGRMLLERARPLAAEPVERADIDGSLGLIEMTRGVPADACRLLMGAARDVAALDADRALRLLNLASIGSIYAGDGQAAVTIAQLARGLDLPDAPATRSLVDLLEGLGAYHERDFATAAPKLRSALALEDERTDAAFSADPVSLVSAGRAAVFLGDERAVLRGAHATATRARASGLLGVLTHWLPRLARSELWAGRWASAAANAREGLRLARELDQPHLVAQQLVVLAKVAAYRGDEDECRSLAGQGRELASRYGLTLVAEFADWALTLLELARGRPAEAFRRAREISKTLVVIWAPLERIEAAVHAGDRQTAESWLDSFESWAASTGVAWSQAVALHCRALLSEDDDEREELFAAALASHANDVRPFERARTELALGEFLRRARRRVEAREHLRAALDAFESLGAAPWAERAREELRASGQTARRRDPSTRDELTPQELQIARFVADGLTNRDVAARLFLSPRTIEFHLRNVFRKLGITSRIELARLDLGGEALTPALASGPRAARE